MKPTHATGLQALLTHRQAQPIPVKIPSICTKALCFPTFIIRADFTTLTQSLTKAPTHQSSREGGELFMISPTRAKATLIVVILIQSIK